MSSPDKPPSPPNPEGAPGTNTPPTADPSIGPNAPLVLLCTDGSAESIDAIHAGLQLLGSSDYQWVLATVVPELDPSMVTSDTLVGIAPLSGDIYGWQEQQEQRGRELLEYVQSQIGIAMHAAELLHGPPGPALRDYAHEQQASLLVVGAQGLGHIDQFFLGSVSAYLVRKAHCPVMVVPDRATGMRNGPVIVATDGSKRSVDAARVAVAQLPTDLPILVTTVSEQEPDQPSTEGVVPEAGEDGLEIMRERKRSGREADIIDATVAVLDDREIQTTVVGGRPREALTNLVASADARALIMGTHGRTALGRAVLGSVAADVTATAECPVILVGPQAT